MIDVSNDRKISDVLHINDKMNAFNLNHEIISYMNKVNPTTCVATSNQNINIPDEQGRNIVLYFIRRMTPLDAPLKVTTLQGSTMRLLRIIRSSMASLETQLPPMKNSSTSLITRLISSQTRTSLYASSLMS